MACRRRRRSAGPAGRSCCMSGVKKLPCRDRLAAAGHDRPIWSSERSPGQSSPASGQHGDDHLLATAGPSHCVRAMPQYMARKTGTSTARSPARRTDGRMRSYSSQISPTAANAEPARVAERRRRACRDARVPPYRVEVGDGVGVRVAHQGGHGVGRAGRRADRGGPVGDGEAATSSAGTADSRVVMAPQTPHSLVAAPSASGAMIDGRGHVDQQRDHEQHQAGRHQRGQRELVGLAVAQGDQRRRWSCRRPAADAR